ncbi:MAG: hypothetical protein QXH91_02125 [Candidatus Bathyarchaeia archaeon]
MESSERERRDEFLRQLKQEWRLLWMERFDDRVRGEGVAVRDYNLLFMDRGSIIFATRDAKAPSFSEIIEFWASQGCVYAPNPSIGGWGKFIRTELKRVAHSRAKMFHDSRSMRRCEKQQLKKGGRGWLHIT